MEQMSILKQSVRRIRDSLALKIFGAVTLVDYVACLLMTVVGWLHWEWFVLLFLFSAASWYFTVSWTPFWNEVMKDRRTPLGQRFADFMENFSLLALALVHCLFTAILVVRLLNV
jgi:hypothetical protein